MRMAIILNFGSLPFSHLSAHTDVDCNYQVERNALCSIFNSNKYVMHISPAYLFNTMINLQQLIFFEAGDLAKSNGNIYLRISEPGMPKQIIVHAQSNQDNN